MTFKEMNDIQDDLAGMKSLCHGDTVMYLPSYSAFLILLTNKSTSKYGNPHRQRREHGEFLKKSRQPGFEPETFLLWGDSVNHSITLLR